ncbi:MAG: hypothetical protein FWD94_07545 [Treponema sp.]|nr:hypothetical protein [Treponema sp.]
MKKIVPVLTALVLTAGMVFAQEASFSGGAIVGSDVLSGDNKKHSELITSGGEFTLRLQASGSTETPVGSFGAWLRLNNTAGWPDFDPNGIKIYGYSWWQPSSLFKLTIGSNPAGWWGMSGITRWGFYAMADDARIASGYTWGWTPSGIASGYGPYASLSANFNQAFYPGFDKGLLLEFAPMDIIAVNIGLPVIPGGETVNDVLLGVNAQVAVSLDILDIGLTYQGGDKKVEKYFDDDGDPFIEASLTDPGSLFGFFRYNSGGIDAHLGIGFHLPYSYELKVLKENDAVEKNINATQSKPIAVGLGLNFDISPEMNVRFRTMAKFGGEYKGELDEDNLLEYKGKPIDLPFQFTAEVLPSYELTTGITAFLGIGAGYSSEVVYADAKRANSMFDFYLSPYIRVGSTWGPSFYAGVEIKSTDQMKAGETGSKRERLLNWRVPISVYYFF